VEAPISGDYRSGDKKLPVVIFSHGLTANAMFYTVICKELASWGLAVFAIDHLDLSCGYTIN
jgi:predicted dienelactone hydrolase